MKVAILKEVGCQETLLGLSLSHGVDVDRAAEVALKLACKDGGENKFLESIYVWLDVTAPRFWWQEADTYRISSKQSESTMHTIHKRLLTQDDFEGVIVTDLLNIINEYVARYQNERSTKRLVELKNVLPEGFLQRRIWVVNYKTLRNILLQRTNHRLPQWKYFCKYITEHVEHSELLLTANGEVG